MTCGFRYACGTTAEIISKVGECLLRFVLLLNDSFNNYRLTE